MLNTMCKEDGGQTYRATSLTAIAQEKVSYANSELC